jgi:hypothetical protein
VKQRRIYVATSWRNEAQPPLVLMLRAMGHEVYDFRNPAPGKEGFAWNQVGYGATAFYEGAADLDGYIKCLEHPRAVEGFKLDKDAMEWADTFVLLLPCGRSAHIEAGWAAGAGKEVHVLLSADKFEPELMYLLCARIHSSTASLTDALGACLQKAG